MEEARRGLVKYELPVDVLVVTDVVEESAI